MQNQEIAQIYTEKIIFYNQKLNKAKKLNRLYAILRGLTFIVTVLLLVFLYNLGNVFICTTVGLFLIIFLFLIKKNIKIQEEIKYLKEILKINQNELKNLNGDISNFNSGLQFIDSDHKFSYDLDIFGEGSIFQSINRTSTLIGTNLLATWFQNPLLEKNKILERQNSVKELTNQIDWRQNYTALGNIYNDDFDDNTNLNKLQQVTNYYYGKKFFKIIIYLLPSLMFVSALMSFLSIVPTSVPVFVFVLQASIVGINIKKSNEIHLKVSKKINLFHKYELLIKEIENLNLDSEAINLLKQKIKTKGKTASYNINQLRNFSKSFDNRLNILFILFVEGLTLWDIQCGYRIEKWQYDFKDEIEKWINLIGEFDTLNSLANFSFNNPKYCYPTIIENSDFKFVLKQGGHPLINHENRINNDFFINKYGFITIVTGANMAGKSTFLRTIGLNIILGMTGSVVCAEEFELTPIQLFTSVRTSDSIQKNESYFFAELKRLKLIIDNLKNNEKLFVIIDEMLRGTNSKDKHLGSAIMIRQLFNLKAVGLVATHDIELGKMIDEFPDNIQNKRFEVDIKNDDLFFDYKIKEGISKNLNAIFLMKKMGIE